MAHARRQDAGLKTSSTIPGLEVVERARDFEIVVLEAIGDLLAGPIDANRLDACGEKIVAAFFDLNAEQLRGLRERLADIRRLSTPQVRGAAK